MTPVDEAQTVLREGEKNLAALRETKAAMTDRLEFLEERTRDLAYPVQRGDKSAQAELKAANAEAEQLRGELAANAGAIAEAEEGVRVLRVALEAAHVEALRAEDREARIQTLETLIRWFDLHTQAYATRMAYEAARDKVNEVARKLQAYKQTAPGWAEPLGSDERMKAEALAQLAELQS